MNREPKCYFLRNSVILFIGIGLMYFTILAMLAGYLDPFFIWLDEVVGRSWQSQVIMTCIVLALAGFPMALKWVKR